MSHASREIVDESAELIVAANLAVHAAQTEATRNKGLVSANQLSILHQTLGEVAEAGVRVKVTGRRIGYCAITGSGDDRACTISPPEDLDEGTVTVSGWLTETRRNSGVFGVVTIGVGSHRQGSLFTPLGICDIARPEPVAPQIERRPLMTGPVRAR